MRLLECTTDVFNYNVSASERGVCGWVGGWVRACVRACVCAYAYIYTLTISICPKGLRDTVPRQPFIFIAARAQQIV